MRASLSGTLLLTVVLPLAGLASCAKPAPLAWLDDYAAAVKQARAEDKNILLNFTGSDWCVNCFRLDDEVFSKPEFADYARGHYVLVTVDFPIKKELSEKVTKQNADLQAKYAVENIPTLVLLDGGEKQLAFVQGYRGEGVQGLLDELNDPAHHPIQSASPVAPPAPSPASANSTAK
jgi:protein disulfide-isomerase